MVFLNKIFNFVLFEQVLIWTKMECASWRPQVYTDRFFLSCLLGRRGKYFHYVIWQRWKSRRAIWTGLARIQFMTEASRSGQRV